MSKLPFLLALHVPFFLSSCGDNKSAPDAPPRDLSVDTGFPRPPQLGPQLDRMGRPAINTALNALVLDNDTVAAMKKDAYDQASDPATWASTPLPGGRAIAEELAVNLAFIDVLDQGNPAIPGTGVNAPGCKNQVLYNNIPGGGGTPAAGSYKTLAAILADDMLYVDTSKTSCQAYLSLEIEAASGGVVPHTQCGGRTPTHDVIDTSYSVLISGLAGFTNPAFAPRITDGVAAHTDVSDTVFPYFGTPH
ncbi:MAG TPA: hypothetical protein VN253_22570 [Kofleriaceae bacterium]|nr:hypothetical protein [Kofleriaceae bacterium]